MFLLGFDEGFDYCKIDLKVWWNESGWRVLVGLMIVMFCRLL